MMKDQRDDEGQNPASVFINETNVVYSMYNQ